MLLERRPAKRTKLLSEEGSSDEDVDPLPGKVELSVNEEYAKRFEHNKKREELQRLEEKYRVQGRRQQDDRADGSEDEESPEDSEEGVSEDSDAEFATKDLDDEISATLQAIRNKDPKVYDKDVRFYKSQGDGTAADVRTKPEKPIFLHDYHRQNLLAGQVGDDDDEFVTEMPQTYQQEQEDARQDLVKSIHAETPDNAAAPEEDDLLVAKEKSIHQSMPDTKGRSITDEDIASAEKDPELYLSNFMAARAWLPSEQSRWQPFDSDDSADEDRAEAFEEAYNMRFEDPKTSNERLQSFARDVGKFGVRRDEKSSRKRARENEREKKVNAKKVVEEERARFKKLKVEELEQKVKRIKHAAGIHGQELDFGKWRDVIDGDFDDEKWEAEMRKRFGEDYYAAEDRASDDDLEPAREKHRSKKPKWEDDIDINDLVPDFAAQEHKHAFTLSSEDEAAEVIATGTHELDEDGVTKDGDQGFKDRKSKRERQKSKIDARRAARRERRAIENIVAASLPLSHPTVGSSMSQAEIAFRYRETSPTSFGLTAKDILFAEDSQLNQYAGLKKLAAFRDPEKKKKDRKKFSKKARLREWRKETFGDRDGPAFKANTAVGIHESPSNGGDNTDGASRKKRKHKAKKVTTKVN